MRDLIDENRSYWAHTAAPVEELPPLVGDVTADVCVIGAGFTGMSTAWHLNRRFPDKRIVVLEAGIVGNGASGRNGGLMLNWVNGVHLEDPEGTARVYHATRDGIDGIESLIREHDLPVRYKRDGALEVYTRADRAEEAHRRTEKLAALGIPVRYLHTHELSEYVRMQGGVGGVLDTTAGNLHGLDLLRAMRPVLLSRGVAIHERSPVVKIEEGATCVITTPQGSVRAAALVLGTNGYTPKLGYFRNELFPLHSHVFATAPLPLEQRAALGWSRGSGFSDDLDRIAYGSITADGSVIFGGGSNASYAYLYGNKTVYPGAPDTAASSFERIHQTFRGYFPDAAAVPIAHRWTGTLGITFSRVCSMGVRGEHRNVYYAVGYSGHGVTLANLAGRVITDLYSDHHEPWRDLPFYQRRMMYIPGEPFRWVGYQAFTRLTGKSPRRVDYG